jgi:hypothetical protein
MTTPAADRLIFAGNRLLKLWRKYVRGTFMRSTFYRKGYQLVPNDWSNRDCKRLPMVLVKSLGRLEAQPPGQTPKQHLVAIRADRKARAQRQRPRLKKPITY